MAEAARIQSNMHSYFFYLLVSLIQPNPAAPQTQDFKNSFFFLHIWCDFIWLVCSGWSNRTMV